MSGHYVVEDCQAWVDENIRHRGEGKTRAEQEEAELLEDEADSPALERYRAARAALAELELAQRMNQVVPIDRLRQGLSSIATILRRTIEQAERQYGRDVADLFVVALDDCDREICNLFDNPDADGNSTAAGA